MTKRFFVTGIIFILFITPFVIYSYYLTPSSVQEQRLDTEIVYQGDLKGQYSDSVIVKALLTEKDTGDPLAGKTIKFVLEDQEISATTDSQGIAQTSLTISQSANTYNIMAIFEGDDMYYGSSDSEEFEVQKEDTEVDYTGPLSGTEDSTITFKAQLSEKDSQVGNLSGKSIRFKLGSILKTATTNNDGKASVSVTLSLSPGTYTLKTEFLGDGYYLSSYTTDSFKIEPKHTGGGNGGGGGGGHCFIATAAYGSPLDKDVAALREFRDKYLLNNPLGKEFVEMYYKYSPPIAELISRSRPLKEITRAALFPIIQSVKAILGE